MSDIKQYEDVAQEKRDADAECRYYDDAVRDRDSVIMALKDALDDQQTGDDLYRLFCEIEFKKSDRKAVSEALIGMLVMEKIARQVERDAINYINEKGSY